MNNLVKLNQIETATQLILTGKESLASCSERFGRNWAAIETSVSLAVKLTKHGEQYEEQAAKKFRREVIALKLHDYVQSAKSAEKSTANTRSLTLQNQSLMNYPSKLFTKLQGNNGRTNALIKALIILVLVLMGGGLFCSIAEASQPGDLLYPTKLQLEKIPSIWLFSEDGKTQAKLDYADARLAELGRALDDSPSIDLNQTLTSYEEAIKELPGKASSGLSKKMAEQLARQQAALHKLEQKSGNNKEALRRIRMLEEVYRTRRFQTSAPAETAPAFHKPTVQAPATITPKPDSTGSNITYPATPPKEVSQTPRIEPTLPTRAVDKRRQILLHKRRILEKDRGAPAPIKPTITRTPNSSTNPANPEPGQTVGVTKSANTTTPTSTVSERGGASQPNGEKAPTTPTPENEMRLEKLKQSLFRLKEARRVNRARASRF